MHLPCCVIRTLTSRSACGSGRLLFHDVRLNHVREFDWQARNVCVTYMGVHQAFASRMLQLAKTSEDGAKTVPPISKFSSYCEHDTFDYRKLNG